jgi:uncharacterized protein (TIGR02996 family)
MDDGELLLAAIARCPGERTPKLQFIDWALEHSESVRARIAAAALREPRLTVRGLEYRSREPHFDTYREALLDAVREFAACRAWVASRKRRRRLNWNRDAHAVLRAAAWELPEFLVPWKRPAEPDERGCATWRTGPLLAAALDAGFRCDRDDWLFTEHLDVGDRLRVVRDGTLAHAELARPKQRPRVAPTIE